MRRLFSTERGRWYLLFAIWFGVVVLGTGGFREQADAMHRHLAVLDGLYNTLALTTFGYQSTGPLNWRLELARFVAPLLIAGTLLQAATIVFRNEFDRFRLRFARGHTVLCGLGDSGTQLACALRDAGHDVVAIEVEPSAPGIATTRDRDVTVLVGDATDSDVLGMARVRHAARLVVMCGSDATNVAVAAVARRVPRPGGRPALRCAVRLADAELALLLRGEELGDKGSARIAFFNLHEHAARAWVAENAPFGDGSRTPHPVVIGLGQLGRNLVVALAQRWHESGDGSPLHVTVVDRVASGRWEALRLEHPALPEFCTPELVDLDLGAPTAAAVDRFRWVLADGEPTSVSIAFADESLALESALFVRQALRCPGVPIVVRARSDAGLGGLLLPIGNDEDPPFPGMTLFPFIDRTCTPEAIEGGVREQLARAIHEDYLARVGVGTGLRRVWEELDDDERESSRREADGIVDGLASIRCDLVPLGRWGSPAVELTAEEVETLACREHARWLAERTNQGWSYGPQRDDVRKHNPLLVPWDDLADEMRDMNRAEASALPVMLARAGLEPIRR